jgi:hypothetical protein
MDSSAVVAFVVRPRQLLAAQTQKVEQSNSDKKKKLKPPCRSRDFKGISKKRLQRAGDMKAGV